MKDSIAAIIISLLLIFSAMPACAQNGYLAHESSYLAEGKIDLKKQAGHRCNTGAEMKQVVSGDGFLSKNADIYMVSGVISVNDENEIETAEFALENLTLSSVIELCAPPKMAFEDDSNFGMRTMGLLENAEDDIDLWYDFPGGAPVPPHLSYLYPEWFGKSNQEGNIEVISDQIWAASVSADQGSEAVLMQDFTAAYGPYYHGLVHNAYNEFVAPDFILDLLQIRDVPPVGDMDKWWLLYEDRGLLPVLGDQYVGNYFTIEQFLNNEKGISKRYIDISSPWNHGYIYEDMTVTGKAEVRETYEMINLPAGSDINIDWWMLNQNIDGTGYAPYYEQYLGSAGQSRYIK